MTGRERMLVGVTLAVALCGGVALGAARLAAARDAADAAAADLADCRRIAGTIESRRGASPAGATASKASRDGDAGGEVTRRIEGAAKSAGLPAGGIERIEPMQVRPIDDGIAGGRGGSEKPTVVQLRGVTLRQALTFFHHVGGSGRPSLRLSQVRLTPVSAEDAQDRWAIESTLTYPVGGWEAGAVAGDDGDSAAMADDAAEQSETEQ